MPLLMNDNISDPLQHAVRCTDDFDRHDGGKVSVSLEVDKRSAFRRKTRHRAGARGGARPRTAKRYRDHARRRGPVDMARVLGLTLRRC